MLSRFFTDIGCRPHLGRTIGLVVTCTLAWTLSSEGDVVVPITIASQPLHGEYFSQDNDQTGVYDVWDIVAPSFPDLTSESGNLIFRVRTPNGERFLVDRQVDYFSVGLHWSIGDLPHRQSVNELPNTVTFLDATSVSSARLVNRGVFASGRLTAPDQLNSVGVSLESTRLDESWGFSGFDIVIPIQAINQQFRNMGIPVAGAPETGFGISLGFTLEGGDFRGTAGASQFSRLIPEPSALLTGLWGLLSLWFIRQRETPIWCIES